MRRAMGRDESPDENGTGNVKFKTRGTNTGVGMTWASRTIMLENPSKKACRKGRVDCQHHMICEARKKKWLVLASWKNWKTAWMANNRKPRIRMVLAAIEEVGSLAASKISVHRG